MRKKCNAIGQDRIIIRATAARCRKGAVTYSRERAAMNTIQTPKTGSQSIGAVSDLQREQESLPFFAPEVRQDGGGCDREHQRHHDSSLTRKHHLLQQIHVDEGSRGRENVPCGSSAGRASGPQRADTLPAPDNTHT